MREISPRDTVLLGAQYICGLSIDFDWRSDGVSFRRSMVSHVEAASLMAISTLDLI